MAKINIPGGDIPDLEPVPAGTYRLRVDSIEDTEASTGADMLVVQLSVIDNDEPDLNGRKIFTNFVYGNEKSLPFLKRFVNAVKGEGFWGSKGFDTDDLVGEEVMANVTLQEGTDEYEGVFTNDIRRWFPVD